MNEDNTRSLDEQLTQITKQVSCALNPKKLGKLGINSSKIGSTLKYFFK